MNIVGIVLLPLWMMIMGLAVFNITIGEIPDWVSAETTETEENTINSMFWVTNGNVT